MRGASSTRVEQAGTVDTEGSPTSPLLGSHTHPLLPGAPDSSHGCSSLESAVASAIGLPRFLSLLREVQENDLPRPTSHGPASGSDVLKGPTCRAPCRKEASTDGSLSVGRSLSAQPDILSPSRFLHMHFFVSASAFRNPSGMASILETVPREQRGPLYIATKLGSLPHILKVHIQSPDR